MCEVPSLFLTTAFDLIDTDQDGKIRRKTLIAAATTLGVDIDTLSAVFTRHSGCDGALHQSP